MHTQRTSLCTATRGRSLQYFAQGYFKRGHFLQPQKLIIQTSTTQNVPKTLFFFIPTSSICLFTEWHIDQRNKYIMALQELLKKIHFAILIAVMKTNAESEPYENGSYTFARCIFHFLSYCKDCSHFSQPQEYHVFSFTAIRALFAIMQMRKHAGNLIRAQI